jgi:geranylgeranyl diphosphate synthase, type I
MADSTIAAVDRARTLLDGGLRAALERLDPPSKRIADYHLGFADAAGAPARLGSGKGIRGVLALLSAQVAGVEAAVGLPAAVGIELVHQYSLLHDDIIDRDESRRHRPAAWTVFGSARAILAGDSLAALALDVILDTGHQPGRAAAAQLLAGATRRMVAGQAADIAFEDAPTVSLDDCLAMVADKTGALLECAASIGALLVGAPEKAVTALADFGRHLGLAFQLVDDLIGLWGHPERSGKPVGSDIASRKKSLPVVAALAAGGSAAARLADIYALPGDLDAAAIGAALDAVDEAGGRRWALAESDRETAAALGILKGIPMDDAVRADLIALTETLCSRDH